MIPSEVSIVRCATYNQEELFVQVKQALELIGGLAKFIKPGSKVLLKPNLLMAITPEAAITTHPEFIRSVILLLKEINCKIYAGDGPSVFGENIENVQEVYKLTGMKRIADEEKVELVIFNKRFIPPFPDTEAVQAAERAGFMHSYFPLTTWVKECDYVINLPKFKTHSFMLLSGAIKNLFGFVPDTFKLECHKNYFQQEKFAGVLLDIYQAVKPALTIVDGISGIEGNGPATSGIKRNFGLILAGVDAVALDVIMAEIMHIQPDYIFTNKEAVKRKLGNTDLNNIEIRGEKLSSCVIADFKLPDVSLKQVLVNKFPGFISRVLKKLITIQPLVDSDLCRLCEACVKNCPQKTMSVRKGRLVIDYAQCISCFCCQEACPYGAIAMRRSFLARVLGI